MKKLFLIPSFLLFFTIASADPEIDTSRYKKITNIQVKGIITPKVIQLETKEFHGSNTLLLNEDGEIIPHIWMHNFKNINKQIYKISSVSSEFEGKKENLVDGDNKTSFSFDPDQSEEEKIEIEFNEEVNISGVIIHLDEGVISPQTISIRAKFNNEEWKTLVAQKNYTSYLEFPDVSVSNLEISFSTPHFLRISELEIASKSLFDGRNKIESVEELTFFAEEGKRYFLFSDAHFGQKTYNPTKKQPLSVDEATPIFEMPAAENNPDFNPDFDNDGINDNIDLCPKIVDPENTDIDNNGRGDACEDPDLDNIYSNLDNCPFAYNPDQTDSDFDGTGDVCDQDANLEILPFLVPENFDLSRMEFVYVFNTQEMPIPKVIKIKLPTNISSGKTFLFNTKNELINHKISGNDLILFTSGNENFRLFFGEHFGQKNYQADSYQPLNTNTTTPVYKIAIAKQNNPTFNPDFDQDGINDADDLCPKDADPLNKDVDKNGKGDICEDPDQDNINSVKDNCPFAYNPNQKDTDQDGIGDKCDNEENRLTETTDIFLYSIFGLGVVLLGFLVFRSLKSK